MKFTLTIDLPESEVSEEGIDIALPRYLRTVANRVERGSADAGTVYTVNGAHIGKWLTEESDN